MVVKRVAHQLKKFRLKRGWTQQQLADRAGLTRGYLARLETARQEPTLTTLGKLAKALGVKIARLLE